MHVVELRFRNRYFDIHILAAAPQTYVLQFRTQAAQHIVGGFKCLLCLVARGQFVLIKMTNDTDPLTFQIAPKCGGEIRNADIGTGGVARVMARERLHH